MDLYLFRFMGFLIHFAKPIFLWLEKLGYCADVLSAIFNDSLRQMLHGRTEGRPFWRVYRNSRKFGLRITAMFGGTKLENEGVRRFIEILARAFARKSYSFVSGAGKGLAMSGTLNALTTAVEQASGSRSRRLGVRTAVEGEEPPIFAAQETWAVRRQKNNDLRELMIRLLANIGDFVFPGSWGTFFELAEAIIRNYVALRTPSPRKARPIFLVDLRSSEGKDYHGGSFWAPILLLFHNMVTCGVLKPGENGDKHVQLWVYRIFVDSEDVEEVVEAIVRVLEHYETHGELLREGWVEEGPFLQLPEKK